MNLVTITPAAAESVKAEADRVRVMARDRVADPVAGAAAHDLAVDMWELATHAANWSAYFAAEQSAVAINVGRDHFTAAQWSVVERIGQPCRGE